jgi:energy-coupling factor transporter ATP-binding protein EcfA2
MLYFGWGWWGFSQVEGVSYRPPGTQLNLLNNVSLSLPDKSLGLIYGRSGSGKTTLLQVLAGLATPTEGSIRIGRDSSERSVASQAGIVFQFPERYFLADTVLEELTFGWSRRAEDMLLRQQLAMRLQAAVFAVFPESCSIS